ncbi:unnamed protein product [Ilex paraguariensis]|uniref:Ubiquitin-like domain-containing protein n=1 Tax=Ilex paraguariensis TaxID=185542 RepID=A0ABC8S519_9AQUA
MPAGKILKLEVKVLYTVHDVKAIVGSMVGFSVSDQSLVYAGNLLEDSKTLACYDIKEEAILKMVPSTIQIFVKRWNGVTMTLDVYQQDTVQDVKNKIFHKVGLPVNVLSLVYAGKLLDNGRDLASYGIQKHSTLHQLYCPSALLRHMKFSEITEFFPSLPDSTTICNLKVLIATVLKSPVKEVFLCGKALQDHFCLVDYDIRKSTVLVVALQER